jgi:predicted permease
MRDDWKHAWRAMRRNPLLALASCVTLTLGIGLNAGVFTVVDGLLFRARVQKDPASFVHLSLSYRNAAPSNISYAVSTRDYRTFAAESKMLRALAAWSVASLAPERDEPAVGILVTCNFFEVYGLARPLLGRLFAGIECTNRGAPPEAVIGEYLWRTRYGSDPHIVGKVMRMNGVAFTVVGVVPAGFPGRLSGPGIWLPWTVQPLLAPTKDAFAADTIRWLTAEGRLAPGHTRAQVRSELQVIAARLDALEPNRQTTMLVTDGSLVEEPSVRADVFWIGSLVMGGLTLILFIACANVAILHLSRAVARQKDMAIRLALGADKWRLTRMLLIETLALSIFAGTAAVAVAYAAPGVFARILANPATPIYPLQPDAAVLAYLAGAVLLTTFFAGLSPAAESLRVNLAASMKAGEGWAASGRDPHRHGFLVALQVALCLVLLVTAGLFFRAERRVALADPGFEAQHVLLVPTNGVPGAMDGIRAVPAVRMVAMGSPFPGGPLADVPVRVPRVAGEERKTAQISTVSADFFATLGVPLVHGRPAGDPQEVVVSEALARTFWPNGNPLGKRLVLPEGTVLVSGVARDLEIARPGMMDPPHVYRWQDPRVPAAVLVVRFEGAAEPVQARVRAALHPPGIDTFVPPQTVHAILLDMRERLVPLVQMVGVVALMALLLATLGTYGVVALAARRKLREMGIRMALGATRPVLIRAMMSSGFRPVAWGVAAGVPMAALAARTVAAGLEPTPIPIVAGDPWLYGAVALLLSAAGISAILAPALRASATDPVQALRQD